MLRWIFTLMLFASPLFAVEREDFVGRWQVPGNPASYIRLELGQGSLVGSTSVLYSTPSGMPTGERIEYFFSFDEKTADGFKGKLSSYDSHFDCFFENGSATISNAGPNKIRLNYSRILFKIREYSEVERFYRSPRYCYSFYWGDYYFCGYDFIAPMRMTRRECVVTERIPSAYVLER